MAELGTAYISIMPSMNGISRLIERELAGINAKGAGGKLGGGIGDGIIGGLSTAKIAIGNVIGNVISSGLNAIGSSIDGAIARVDTLNQFPKTMQNLGYSGDAAKAVIDRLGNSIEGLPTALDEIVSSTKTWTLSLGDMERGADVAVAMNNALLSFGASGQYASNAMTQLNQMVTTGKYDMQSWNSVNQSAPGLLDTVAKAMLGTGASAYDLRDSLNSGKVTTEEFLDKMIELNAEGAEGLASFSESARASTAGIETSMANVRTAITKNLANIIDDINASGAISDFFDLLKGAINAVGSALRPMASAIGEWLSSTIAVFKQAETPLEALHTAFGGAFSGIGEILVGVAERVSGPLASISENLQSALGQLGGVVNSFLYPVVNVISALFENIVVPIFESFTAFVSAYIMPALQQLGDAFSGLVESLSPLIEALRPVAEFLGNVLGAAIWLVINVLTILVQAITFVVDAIVGFVTMIADALAPFFTWIAETVMQNWQTVAEIVMGAIDAIVGFFTGLWDGICSVVGAIGDFVVENFTRQAQFWVEVWNGIASFFTGLWDGICETVSGAVEAIEGFVVDNFTRQAQFWIDIWNSVCSFFAGIWDSLVSTVSTNIEAIFSFIRSIPDTVMGFFANAGQWLLDAGHAIIDGLLGGIRQAWDNVISFFSGIGDAIVGTARAALGIGSPSRLMRDEIGRWIPAGIGEGIERFAGLATDPMAELAGELTSAADISPFARGLDASVSATRRVEVDASSRERDERLGRLVELTERMLAKDTVISIDGRAVARATASAADREQGARSALASRGVALS